MQQSAKPKQEIWFQKEIKELLKQEKTSPAPQGAIVFTGSSIFRFWVTLARDMSPMPVVNRAFGGARTWELLHYMDRIIMPCKPGIIACYCGGNDIECGSRPEDIALRLRQFRDRVHALLPETPIFFVSLNKAPQKLEKWGEIDTLNNLVEAYCRRQNKVGFIDINPAFFNAQGQPRRELYISDGLHFMPDAYREITRAIRPVLDQAWQKRHGQP